MNQPTEHKPHRFCVAPMMDWTDRHCRYFMRLLSRHALLYTEMVTTGALLHADKDRFLRYNPEEHPVALQLGGSNPDELARCTTMAHQYGYDEVNLNAGCPSDRVQNNLMGACLMARPALVRDCLSAMNNAASIRVTLKTRIGIDNMDSDQELIDFVGITAESGIDTLILHARIALLDGLSPKQNREVPPLNYARARLIKATFPHMKIILNGGIADMDAAEHQLEVFDGVMLGRAAYQQPWILQQVDKRFFDQEVQLESREQAIRAMLPYIEQELGKGASLHHITRHMLGLFHGERGGKRYRRHLSEHAWQKQADTQVLTEALSYTLDS